MRVVIAPDGFGGTLSAADAAEAIAAGWRRAAPHDSLEMLPLSDGGPGFVRVLHQALGGRLVPVTVPGPLGAPVAAELLHVGDTAYVESAQACGLHLIPPAERDPTRTTTAGVGELVAAAAARGADTVVVGLGGSGTNDGGAGLLQALGWELVGTGGGPVDPGGVALRELAAVRAVPLPVRLVAATDVDNPLTGISGASAVYGPQKGATREDVAVLDSALAHLASVMARDVPSTAGLAAAPGAGAAGGLGFALMALGARRESGIALVLHAVGLDAHVEGADLVVTGEGRYDAQSLRGKVVSGVAQAAQRAGVPCVVLAGQVEVGRREAAASGVEETYALRDVAGTVEAAMAEPRRHLEALAARVAARWSGPAHGGSDLP